ncbi:hypothetical protein FSP39_007682 [Pinctada imbricata]|uniref:Uncharacterized protein n=1 Tax=Pinctada imbricata TaxID=66713 RepID=A0AA88XKQ0_PINIB|nr:hypothetical protein FSP39_007682 [Pinctada imbricata]
MADNNTVADIKENTKEDVESTQSKRRAKITNRQRYFNAKDARKFYDINVYKAYQSHKFRTMGKKYTVQFKDMSKDITPTEFPKVLPNIMNTLVDDLKNENNIKDADYVRSIVHQPSLKSEIWIPFSQSTEMSGDAILQEVQKVQQSNEDFKMEDGQTTIDLLHVEMPMGSGGESLKHLHSNKEAFRKGKRSIVSIVNDKDHMCLSRAIVVTMVNTNRPEKDSEDWKKEWDKIIRPKGYKLQTERAKALCDQAGVSSEHGCGPTEWEKFQKVLMPNYKLKIYQQNAVAKTLKFDVLYK